MGMGMNMGNVQHSNVDKIMNKYGNGHNTNGNDLQVIKEIMNSQN